MTIQFLPYSVRGAAAFREDLGRSSTRGGAGLPFTVEQLLAPPRTPLKATTPLLSVLGPGDVVGIDPAQILRRFPEPSDARMEPNYLAAIEFAHPDLPWLFSPKPALLPWVMLIVIADPDGDKVRRTPGATNPAITVPGNELPDPVDGGWAHVQVDADPGADLTKLLTRPSERVRSRVLCPRRLHACAAYVACLVPVFEAGRRAGLDESVDTDPGDTWVRGDEVQLPVYDHWRFHTGPEGDFELLATALGKAANPGMGHRRMVVEPVASRLRTPPFESAASAQPADVPPVREVATALSGPGAADRAPAGPHVDAVRARLKELLDITTGSTGTDEPIVGPPLYGQWHADVVSLDGHEKSWVTELNADPENRVVAGLGARVVQRDQELLMAEAWAQLESVMEANRRIRWAQLAAAVADPLHRGLASLPSAQILRVAGSANGSGVHAVVPVADGTPELALTDAPATVTQLSYVEPVLEPAFVRAARYASASVADVRTTPLQALDSIANGLAEGATDFLPLRFEEVIEPEYVPGDITGPEEGTVVDVTVPGTDDPVEEVVIEPFEAAELPVMRSHLLLAEAPPAAAPDHVSSLGEVAESAVEALEPQARYTKMLREEHVLDVGSPGRPWQRSPLDPIMAAPTFDTPAVDRLRALDQEWVVGGVGRLGENEICVMADNHRFVEAFLAGANHEMARELRWRGYPTDLRGSYFRRFWPTLGTDGDGRPVGDVGALDGWANHLGDHPPPVGGRSFVVIVIKAELLRRYPGTLITTEMGSVRPDRTFESVRRAAELFRGRLDPDVAYLALNIPPDDLFADSGGHRWYLSLCQPLDEPRFGLDEYSEPMGSDDLGQHEAPENGPDPDQWTWQGLRPPDPPFLASAQVGGAGAGSSANVAANLFQRPVHVLLSLRDFVPMPVPG